MSSETRQASARSVLASRNTLTFAVGGAGGDLYPPEPGRDHDPTVLGLSAVPTLAHPRRDTRPRMDRRLADQPPCENCRLNLEDEIMIAIRKTKVLGTCVRGSPIAFETAFKGFDVTAYGISETPFAACRRDFESSETSKRDVSERLTARSPSYPKDSSLQQISLSLSRRSPVVEAAAVFPTTSWLPVSL